MKQKVANLTSQSKTDCFRTLKTYYLPIYKCLGYLDAKGTEIFELKLPRQQLTSSTVAQTRLDAVLARRTKFGVFVPRSSDFQHLTCVGWFFSKKCLHFLAKMSMLLWWEILSMTMFNRAGGIYDFSVQQKVMTEIGGYCPFWGWKNRVVLRGVILRKRFQEYRWRRVKSE